MAVIAIFGGSFSPVHIGHMAVAKSVLDKGLADEVWLLPCRQNPLKEEDDKLPDTLRLQLLEKAAEYTNNTNRKNGIIRVKDIELDMPSPSYTCDTLRKLTELYPRDKFRLVAGADSYKIFEKWKEWEWIENNFSPIVYPRPGYQIDFSRPKWTMLDGVEELDVSSTAIREKIKNGKFPCELMPWAKREK